MAQPSGGAPCEITIYRDYNFEGHARVLYGNTPDLRSINFNDQASSFVIKQGTWALFQDVNYRVLMGQPFGPGQYPNVTQVGVKNDALSSLQCIGP